VVEHLCSKSKALSSNTSTAKKQNNNNKKLLRLHQSCSVVNEGESSTPTPRSTLIALHSLFLEPVQSAEKTFTESRLPNSSFERRLILDILDYSLL
jgi:hypothetical protein